MARQALGKGLDALIADSSRREEDIAEVDLGEIVENPLQPRRVWSEERLAELAQSIKEQGVLQPIILRRLASGFELVAGERRWRAARMAGLATVPARIVDIDERMSLEIALIENLQREDLGPLEEARAYQTYIDEFGVTQEEVAKRVGKSRAQVANMVRLLRLHSEVQGMLDDGSITVAHGKILAGLSEDRQVPLARKCCDEGWTVRGLEEASKGAVRQKVTIDAKRAAREESDVERYLRDALGTKVLVERKKGGRGAIRIEFYDEEGLERLVQMLAGSEEAESVPRGTLP